MNGTTTETATADGATPPSLPQQSGVAARVLSMLRSRLQHSDVPAFDLTLQDGTTHSFPRRDADSPGTARAFHIHLRTPRAMQALASLDEYSIADAFVSGDIDVEGSILAAFSLRRLFSDGHPLLSAWRFVRPLIFGRTRVDKASIQSHYDLGNEFYWAFLDRRHKLYSQALYRSESNTLEEAAENKLEYICDACRLRPGSRVLDVGAGWGSFSRYAAARGIDVTMLTLSNQQYAYLSQLSAEQPGPGRLDPHLTSIYDLDSTRRFDAIVLLGVMEHLPDYRRLMRRLDRLLDRGGYVYMDFAADQKKYDIGTFAHQSVFPGDHSPVVVHELLGAANERDFEIIEIRNDRHSYYLTTKAWAERLEASRRELVQRYGERAFRSFQLYLWSIANSMHTVTDLLSYRVVLKKSIGLPSEESLGPA